MERLYLDTSVFGGYFEPEFEFWTKLLFDKIIKGKMKMLYSQMTEIELSSAPQHIGNLIKEIPNEYIEFLPITNEANELAEHYIQENVVVKTNRPDCLHIAIATINNADILVSWNFKHIVNVSRIRGYNGVNYKLGNKVLEIRTARDILEL